MTRPYPYQFKSINYSALAAGPRLIISGAVHGNETCGTVAINRVMAQFDSGELQLVSGSLTFVPVANPMAYALGQRSGERNPEPQPVPQRRAAGL